MPGEEMTKLRLEIVHVLFIDIVGYSKLRINQQSELLRELNEIVSGTSQFREADAEGKLIRLPTGDGMALVFRTNPAAPAQCALEISQALDRVQTEQGHDVPIHVDGASGGFVAPFLQPELEWDFRVPRVASINASGHKYGLVYPGVGWVMWRTPDALPEDLVFKVNYLGGEMPTFALNFSRPGAQVAAQYYNFIRLGRQGYQRVQHACRDVALHLSAGIAKMGPFELLTEGRDLPVFAFKLRDDVAGYSVFDVSERLRMRGWQVPAYTFPADLTDTAVMRIVVRNGFSMDLANLLLADLRKHVKVLEHHPQTQPPPEIQHMRESFKH